MREEEKRTRLRSQEQSDLVDILAVGDRIDQIKKRGALRDRLKGIKRGSARLGLARWCLLSLSEDILNTTPTVQLQHMRNNLRHIRLHIYTGNAVQNKDKLEGRWFDINEMNTIATAIREVCQVCPYDNTMDQRKCQFKKLMDCLPVDPDETTVGCGWFTRLGRG